MNRPGFQLRQLRPGGGTTALRRLVAIFAGASLLALQIAAQAPVGGSAPSSPGDEPLDSASAGSGSPATIPAARQADRVAIITIQGQIDKWTEYSVSRRMERAVDGGADAIVFEIDTPGGEVGAVRGISSAIKNSPIPNTVAWVNPDAFSGGAIIAIACREIVAAQSATMGDALPIMIGPMGMQSMSDAERQKFVAPLLADVVDSARRNGYDERLVQAFVTLGVELWLIENIETGERRFVSADEYQMLFDEEPPRADPAQPVGRFQDGAESGGGDGGGLGQWVEKLAEKQKKDQQRGGEGDGRSASEDGPAMGRDPLEIASDDLPASIAEDVQSRLDTPAPQQRPLTADDRGKWRLLTYVTDGNAPLTLTTQQMLAYGFSSQIVTNEEELKQFFGAKHMARMDRTWSESMARILSTLPVQGLLIVLFLLGLFMEMSAPGLGLPGAIAAIAFAGLLAPQVLVGAASWWALAAVGGGLVLIAAEVFILPGFGVFGVGGVVTLFIGLVGVVSGPGGLFPSGPGGSNELLWSAATTLLAMITTGVGIYFIAKHYGSIPFFNKLILVDEPPEERGMLAAMAPATKPGPVEVGDIGVATTSLRPAGSAEFGDRLVDVVSEFGYVERGQKVRATSVTKYRVAVEAVEGDVEESA